MSDCRTSARRWPITICAARHRTRRCSTWACPVTKPSAAEPSAQALSYYEQALVFCVRLGSPAQGNCRRHSREARLCLL